MTIIRAIFVAILTLCATPALAEDPCGTTTNQDGWLNSTTNDWGTFGFGGFGDGFAGADGTDFSDAKSTNEMGGGFEADENGFEGDIWANSGQYTKAKSMSDEGEDSIAMNTMQNQQQMGYEAMHGNDCEDCPTYFSGGMQTSQQSDAGAIGMGQETYAEVEGGLGSNFKMEVGEETEFGISSWNTAKASGRTTLQEGGQALAGSSVFTENGAQWGHNTTSQEPDTGN